MRPQACSILLVLIVLLSAPFLHLTYALSSTGKQTPTSAWQHCLIQYAHDIDIHPALLRAIVQAESAGHPWAFGWTDRTGGRHSYTARGQEEAAALLLRLLNTAANVDIGLAQINSQHLTWLATHHEIHPHDLLSPCVNLRASSLILHTKLQRHGHTWMAIAGYNGSTRYIQTIWNQFCRRAPHQSCLAGRAAPPPPSAPLPLTFAGREAEAIPDQATAQIVWQSRLERDRILAPASSQIGIDTLRAILVITIALLCGGIGLALILALGARLVLLAVYIVREGLHLLRRQQLTHRRMSDWHA